MALQVWLPLTGNLNNQGLSNVTVTVNGGSTSYTDGKIGQCLSGNGSTYWTISGITLGAESSICCWTKTSTNNKMSWVLNANVYAHLNLYENNIYTLNIGDSNNNPFVNDSGSNISVLHDGLWHHFAVTFAGTNAKLYIDGSYRGKAKTYRSPATPTNSYIKLGGGFSNGHSYDWNGGLNDFRIYDHALSPKEVREISKALVLHYPLNELPTRTNIFTGRFTVYKTSTTVTTTGSLNSVPAATILVNKGKTMILSADVYSVGTSANTNSSTNRFGIHGAIRYTLSGASSSTQAYPLCLFTPGYNGRVSVSWTIPSNISSVDTVLSFSDQASTTSGYYARPAEEEVTWYYRNVKLEFGNSASDFMNTTTEDNIVYDDSGYCHNGSVNGSLNLVSSSERYKKCLNFANGSIRCTDFCQNLSEDFTVSLWVNINSIAANTWFISGSNLSLSRSFNFGLNANTTMQGLIFTNPTGYHGIQNGSGQTGWHMYTMVSKNDSISIYIDGVLYRTQSLNNTSYNAGSLTSTFIDISQGNYSRSDVRIYATALSTEAILELYNTPAYLTNNGSLYAFEFDETTNTDIRKIGIVDSGKFVESGTNYTEDVTISGSGVTNFHPSNANNSCSGGYSVNYANIIPGKVYIMELDLSWTGTWSYDTSKSYGTTRFQGANNGAWQGTNYLTAALNNKQRPGSIISSTPGSYHYKVTFSIPASHLETYSYSAIGTRTDYMNGEDGKFSLSNLKIYPQESNLSNNTGTTFTGEQAKFGQTVITTNRFNEI